jgi:hypothetical protein
MCQYLYWPQGHVFFGGGGKVNGSLHSFAVKLALHQLPSFFERLSPLLAAPAALLLSQGDAKAILTYNIFESGGSVVFQASGSLNLTGANVIGTTDCGTSAANPGLRNGRQRAGPAL